MNKGSMERTLLRVEEAAEACGYSRSFLYQAINRGEIPVIRLGKTCRIPASWLQQWIERKVKDWEDAHGQSDQVSRPFGGGR